MSDVAQASRTDAFRAAVSLHGRVAADPGVTERYGIDGLRPELVASPSSPGELAAVLSEARTEGLSLIPAGSRTHLSLGNIPDSFNVAISTERLAEVLEYEPADLTISVGTGVSLAELQGRLAEHRQFLPLDPPGSDAATVGGVLGANAFGPLRHGFGTARDWLIGVRVAHADGTITKAGGRVVKNVAGYDMSKLYVGSLGSLGVIAEATFKVAPRPKAQATVTVTTDSPHGACTLLFATHDAGLSVHAAELLSPPSSSKLLGLNGWTLLLRVAGGPGALDRSLREIHALSEGTQARFEIRDGTEVWSNWRRAFAPSTLAARVNTLPSRVADTVEAFELAFGESPPTLSATVMAGVIRAHWSSVDDATAANNYAGMLELCGRTDASMILDSAPPSLKQHVDVFGDARGDLEIMRRLKHEFDPTRMLSPGRFAGRL